MEAFDLKAINFSAYGASFVNLDSSGNVVTPLYNYLKPFADTLKDSFYNKYGGEEIFSVKTASPVLGNLNSGLQIYRLKHEKPEVFNQIKRSLHLPQYLSYLVSDRCFSDITSIGCHTALWNFQEYRYHDWVHQEGIGEKLAPIHPSNQMMNININDKPLLCGTGLHDSSAALIPYLASFQEPFVLISTGTWCITLNPFNKNNLTPFELTEDCLCYMDYHGNPVKAARLFAGNEHEIQTKKLAAHYNVANDYYKTVSYQLEFISKYQHNNTATTQQSGLKVSSFETRNLNEYPSYEEAYHQLIIDIMQLQVASTNLVLQATTKKLFVDGGFSKNPIYMNLLAAAFPTIEVYSTYVAQATAIGAAIAVHKQWNTKPLPVDKIIQLKRY
jgi:sugar (pentulose or hexulose) kinase